MAEETGENFIYVRERRLPYQTFDADNHLYETKDAFLQFLPKEYEGAIKYVDVNGRTKLAIRDHISEYIPNPTFNKVAVPGGYGRDVTKGDGKPIAGAAVGVKPTRDAGHGRLLRPGATPGAHEGHGNRPHAAVADARERARGARRG